MVDLILQRDPSEALHRGRRPRDAAPMRRCRGLPANPHPPARFATLPSPVVAASGRRATRSRPASRRHSVKLLIPVWGEEYIAAFCRTVLPALLSPNNLPSLTKWHAVAVT